MRGVKETDISRAVLSESAGVFGKWHNGNDAETPEFRAHFDEANKDKPNKKPDFGHGVNTHGFDEAWVYYGGGPDHFNRRTVNAADAGK